MHKLTFSYEETHVIFLIEMFVEKFMQTGRTFSCTSHFSSIVLS